MVHILYIHQIGHTVVLGKENVSMNGFNFDDKAFLFGVGGYLYGIQLLKNFICCCCCRPQGGPTRPPPSSSLQAPPQLVRPEGQQPRRPPGIVPQRLGAQVRRQPRGAKYVLCVVWL